MFETVKYPVCRVAFMNIHGLKTERIDYLNRQNRGKKRNITDAPCKDLRGINGNHNRMPEETTKPVQDFIATLPVRSSHYTRYINEHKQYLDYSEKKSLVSIHKSYLHFVNCHFPKVNTVKMEYFRKIWNTQYNINIECPKVDICPVCYSLKQEIEQLKSVMKNCEDIANRLLEHKSMAQAAYDNLKMAKKTEIWAPGEWVTLCVDLQQTHNIPKTPVGPHFI